MYVCEMCECEVRKNNKARHEKTEKHKDNVIKNGRKGDEGS